MKIRTVACLILGILLLPMTTQAAIVQVKGKITRTLVSSEPNVSESTVLAEGVSRFGECMAALDIDLVSEGLDCTTKWVTFSCSGEYGRRSIGMQKFDSAQFALALGKVVRIWVNDKKKHNDHCFAERIVVTDEDAKE